MCLISTRSFGRDVLIDGTVLDKFHTFNLVAKCVKYRGLCIICFVT
jgi:hypothetical protein